MLVVIESSGESLFGYTLSYHLHNVAFGQWVNTQVAHAVSDVLERTPPERPKSGPPGENAVATDKGSAAGDAGANRSNLGGGARRRDGEFGEEGSVGHGRGQVKRGMVASTLAERLTVLQNCTLLGSLPEDVQIRIAGFAHDRVFRDGKTILRKGDPGSSMMLVMQGRVRICVLSPDGKEITFSVIDQGKVFGEFALIDGKCRSANAVALGDTHLLVIERRAFIPFLENNPSTTLQLLLLMCERARTALEMTENVAFFDVPIRLARLFLKLAGSHGKQTPEGIRIDVRLSQRDLGNLVATSRETVNKLIRQWQREELLEMDDGTVTIRELRAFEMLANL
jgi:CRP-like cAMP-binding protein